MRLRGGWAMALLVLAILAVGAGWLGWLLRVNDLAEDLVTEANRAAAADRPPRRALPRPGDAGAVEAYRLATASMAERARTALGAGRVGEAVERCLEGLALARDAAFTPRLQGRLIRADVLRHIGPPCAEIAAGPGIDRLALADRVRALRDGAPGLEAALRADGASTQLVLFGGLLSAAQRARLAPPAAAQASPPREPSDDLWIRLAEHQTWREIARGYQALAEAARLEPGARRAALEAFDGRWSTHRNPVVRSMLGLGFAHLAILEDEAVLRQDLVILAAAARLHRDRSGAWPRSLADVDLTAEERARLQGADLTEEAGRLRIRAPLPEAKDSPRELAVTVAP